MLLLLVGTAMVSRIAKAFQDYIVNVIIQKFGAALFTDGLKHSMQLPYQAFEDQRSGETLSILTKARADCEKFISYVINVVFGIVVSVVFVSIYATRLHWSIIPIYMGGASMIAYVTNLLSKKIKSFIELYGYNESDKKKSTAKENHLNEKENVLSILKNDFIINDDPGCRMRAGELYEIITKYLVPDVIDGPIYRRRLQGYFMEAGLVKKRMSDGMYYYGIGMASTSLRRFSDCDRGTGSSQIASGAGFDRSAGGATTVSAGSTIFTITSGVALTCRRCCTAQIK
jgi:hypothetical protein